MPWAQVTDYPHDNAVTASLLIGDVIYALGNTLGSTFTLSKYESGGWTDLATYNSTGMSPALLWDGADTLVAIDYGVVNPIYAYSISGNTWTQLTDWSYEGTKYYCGAFIDGGTLYVLAEIQALGKSYLGSLGLSGGTWGQTAVPYTMYEGIGGAVNQDIAYFYIPASTYAWYSYNIGSAEWRNIGGPSGVTYNLPGGVTSSALYCSTNGSSSIDAQVVSLSVPPNTLTQLTTPPMGAEKYNVGGSDGGGCVICTAQTTSGVIPFTAIYTPPEALSGASVAPVAITAIGAGSGTETGKGAAIATVTASPAGAGKGHESAQGAATAAITATALGRGSGADQIVAGSRATVTLTSSGAGQARDVLSGAATAAVALFAAGAGVIEAGISGAVQDFPDWVPPHVVIATDNVIYASAPDGDALPFRPTFVGLGGWASVILTLAALPVEVLAALSVVMEWTSAGSVIATRVIDLIAGTDVADTVAGVQVATVARSDELRVTIPAAAGVGRVLLTLAATTRAIGEAVTPATFPGSAQYAAGPAAGSISAAGHLDLYAGPYSAGSRLIVAPAAALTVTASRLDVAAGGYTPYDAASWSVTDTAGGPLYLPAPAGVTRWRLTNAAGAPVSVDYYVEGVST